MSIFSNVAGMRTKKSKFNLSHERKLSLNMGELIPIYLEEIVPGDNFKVNTELLLRMSPLTAPVMHRINVYTHYFFVPNRIVWDNWESFITGGKDGTEMPEHPQVVMNQVSKSLFTKGNLSDYFGLPTMDGFVGTDNQYVSGLPFRAYTEIYNEYYRDQNLTDAIEYDKTDGTAGLTEMQKICAIRRRAWEKDYYTSALPWAQRGDTALIPTASGFRTEVTNLDGSEATTGAALQTQFISGGNQVGNTGLNIQGSGDPVNIVNEINVNDLRKSVRLQEWLEKNARGGYRYLEQLLHHWGVISSDARLQRPEYLGGGRQPITISEVLQTSATVVDGDLPHENLPPSPQGNMSGHGISVGRSNRFKKRFEEHGHVLGIMSVIPRTSYQNGLERLWSRDDKFKYAWPEFAQLGEQEILSREVYHDWQNPNISDTFGYQSRYAEYKYKQSTVHGDFRDSLYYWHMGRIFDSRPVLNESFVTSDPTQRIFNVDDEEVHKLYVQIYNSVKAIRPLPFFNTPTL